MRVGVIGGGQLAWMMADAARSLAVDLIVQTPEASDPAVAIATETILAPIDDAAATAQLAAQCDVITFENEFIDLEALTQLEKQGVRFYPQLTALAPLLDKYHQRCYLRDIGLPTPEFSTLEAADTLSARWLSYPIVLKARRHGYDGQGTFVLKDRADLEKILANSARQAWLVEEFVPFERELAIMAARSTTGKIVTYPVVETQQEAQVCHRVFVTSDLATVEEEVEAIAHTLLTQLNVVGIFGIELFLTRDGKVLVNEIAPRTHNSGHYTLDACVTSQFEQHLRAVCGLPLGNPALRTEAAVMVNLLGYEHSQSEYLEKRQQLSQIPQAQVHWYGKTESRPGRKLGHVTVLMDISDAAKQRSQATEIAQTIESIWYQT
ncbi:5-(carboxyamino)imidazole ribonucleotide synthase [Leptolyngbya sp. FACHB-671]|uniref:5-(carboxyamino)imidazole ribonucleotide synthase n=1 Tax=Leptolyngbya sp. FACHB-671 TaxID=2692812 RepID=UPI001682F3D1|nr:5-(carboxyamino)imidazole ribonucleotide synthase [Leptolyngbya sp. FACHB-671]MBD2072189.1 5-(carboxyamino)imidazole ribonucleotide synthase [Leptolyngbya sp. FACHB-671]